MNRALLKSSEPSDTQVRDAECSVFANSGAFPDDYIGESTRAEIAYATGLGKRITYRADRSAGARVFVEGFAAQLRDVRAHISDEPGLTMLHGVHLEAGGGRLYVVATNRFTLAATCRDTPGIGTWDVLMPRAEVDTVLNLARVAGTDDAHLARTPTGLVVHIGEYTVAVDRADEHGEFPRRMWRTKVTTALAAGPALDTEIVVDRRRLAAFAPTHDTETGAVQLWGSGGPHDPLVITRGTDYIGLLMPMRRGTDGPTLDEVRAAWRLDDVRPAD
ncbi:hypothetical protein [Embleya sp. NPDC050493]|uniref:hypothetical protein n=1 Tax=Embleya sp. NPDC050493 TaxID=3363989 RepID=UPI00379F81E1